MGWPDLRRTPGAAACLILVTLGLLGLRWAPLAERPLDHDEHITLLALTGHQLELITLEPGRLHDADALRSLQAPDDGARSGVLLEGLRATDVHPPLYFLLAQRWLLLAHAEAGPPEAVDVWLRLFSAILLTAAALLGAGLAHGSARWGGAGLFLLLGLGAHPVQVAATARPYALLILMATLSLLAAHRMLRDPDGRLAPVFLGASLGGGLLTHYLSAPLAVGVLVGLAAAGVKRHRVVSAAALAAALFLPWLLFTAGQPPGPPEHLLGRMGVGEGLHLLGQNLCRYLGLVGLPEPLARPSPWLVAAAALVGATHLTRRREAELRMLGWSLLVPLGAPLLLDVLSGTRLLASPHSMEACLPVLGWTLGMAAREAVRTGRRAWVGTTALALATTNLLASAPMPSEPWRALAAEPAVEDATRGLVLLETTRRGQVLRGLRYLRGPAEVLALPAGPDEALEQHLEGRDTVWRLRCCAAGSAEAEEAWREPLEQAGFRLGAAADHPRTGWSRWTR